MATELLAIGTAAGASADFIVAAGGSAMVYLKDATAPDIGPDARIALQIKDGADYFTVDQLTAQKASLRIDGDALAATTYRWWRFACSEGVGVGRVS